MVIAVGMVGRNGAFIAPEEMYFGPVDASIVRSGGDPFKDRFRGRASGEGDKKGAMVFDGPVYRPISNARYKIAVVEFWSPGTMRSRLSSQGVICNLSISIYQHFLYF